MVNSRNKGNSYERKLMNEYKEHFPNCRTSRNESKLRDDQGVDLCNTGCFNIQAKAYKNFSWGQIIKTLKAMPVEDNYNLLHLKIDKPGERWEVVCMDKADWYEIMDKLKYNGII